MSSGRNLPENSPFAVLVVPRRALPFRSPRPARSIILDRAFVQHIRLRREESARWRTVRQVPEEEHGMAAIDLKSLVGRLNEPCRRALEAAAGLTLSRTHY